MKKQFERARPYDDPTILASVFDVIKFTGQVHSRLKKKGNVSEDIVLAKLDEKDKVFLIEQFNDANNVYNILGRLDVDIGQKAHDLFTYKSEMIALLNRNKENNDLIEIFNDAKRRRDESEEAEMPKARIIRKEVDDDERD